MKNQTFLSVGVALLALDDAAEQSLDFGILYRRSLHTEPRDYFLLEPPNSGDSCAAVLLLKIPVKSLWDADVDLYLRAVHNNLSGVIGNSRTRLPVA